MAHDIDEAPVLFAYDGSEYAKHAIQQAARELRPGRHAIVLTVWQLFGAFPFASLAIRLPEDLTGLVEEEARKIAAEGASLARQAGFSAEPAVQEGDPVWQRIADAADHHDASVVVLGSHGRTGIPAVLMGSVAAAVARHTPRNVLIVHHPAPA
jgi:nucleotide-binding universal stress UspA family protein